MLRGGERREWKFLSSSPPFSISCSASVFVALSRGSSTKKKRKKKGARFGLCPPYLQKSLHQHISKCSNGPKPEGGGGSDFCCEANWLMHSKRSAFDFCYNWHKGMKRLRLEGTLIVLENKTKQIKNKKKKQGELFV